MSLIFYPHIDETMGTLSERIDVLMDFAQKYKAVVLDNAAKPPAPVLDAKRIAPKDQTIAYNWDEIASVLREAREQPEATKPDRLRKADYLAKLAEVYEVLRAARMSKLEAVRLALMTEANQLRGGSSSQVA